jgi:hypothetical protein
VGARRLISQRLLDDVGSSLRNASANVNRVARSGTGDGSGRQSSGSSGHGADADPWASDGPGGYSDEPPYLHPPVTASVRFGVFAVLITLVWGCLSLLPVP